MAPARFHRNTIDGVTYTWDVETLWVLAAGLPVTEVEIAGIPGIEEDCWFGGVHVPTVRNVVAHTRRILDADFSHPIILNVDGSVMDGLHRVARAMLEGRQTVLAVRFEVMPAWQGVEPVARA